MVQGLREPTSKDDQSRTRNLEDSGMEMDLGQGLKTQGPQSTDEEMDIETVQVNLNKVERQMPEVRELIDC